LEKAKQLSPDSSEVRFQLAGVLRALKQSDRSREEFKVFEEQKQANLQVNIGTTKAMQANQYLESGDAAHAVEFYREAIREGSQDAKTYYNLALALARIPDRPGERLALQQAIQLDGRLVPALNQLGLLDLEDGKVEDAEKRFKTALSLDPESAEAQSSLGVIYGRQGKSKEAEQFFRRAIENDPHYAQAYVNLGLILAGQDRLTEAEKEIQNAVRIAPEYQRALMALGMVQARLGRHDLAVENLRKVVAADPKSSEAHVNLGIALADGFNLEEALAQFSESVRLAPNSPIARYNKGRALYDLHRNDEAKPELDEALRLAPSYAGPAYLLGLIEKQADHPRASATLMEKVVILEPDNADALYALGQNYLQLGNQAGAVARWKQVLEIDPERAEALYNLSRALAKSDPGEAQRYQVRFTELQQKRHITDRAETLANFAIAAAGARDWAKAVGQLKEALEICGNCRSRADLHKNLGLIYCRSGNVKDGTAELITAKKLKPSDPDIEMALRVLRVSQQ
jgi:tetratricopeptide (TPR) repeat protein